MDAIFFDLDGTLVDSAPEIRGCLYESLLEQGAPSNEDVMSRFRIGPPLEAMIRIMAPSLSNETVRAVIGSFRARYDSSDYALTKPFPGINDLLEQLAGTHIPLYVATNKPLYASTRIVQAKGWSCFSAILSPNSVAGEVLTKDQLLRRCAAEHAYRPNQCVMVGDLQDDVEAARRAGFLSAWVSWGCGDKSEAADWGADWIIDAPAGLLATLRNIRDV